MDRKISLVGSFSTDWIRYSDYECRQDSDNSLYIVPAANSTFSMYNPFDVAESLVMDILKIGDISREYRKSNDIGLYEELQRLVLLYAKKYGLFGFISASAYNRDIIGDDTVLVMSKNFVGIKDKTASEQSYVKLFTPFAEE